jgi:hypothetical protein
MNSHTHMNSHSHTREELTIQALEAETANAGHCPTWRLAFVNRHYEFVASVPYLAVMERIW